eukprot:gene1041-2038_t
MINDYVPNHFLGLSIASSALNQKTLCNARQFQKNDVIYIPTAAYAFDKSSLKPRGEQRRRARYDAKIKASQLQILFDANEVHTLELDDSKMSYSKIDDAFKNAGIVYVDGGNTFYLQGYLQKTNFWSTIEKYLKNGCLYVGASAGAIVAGKSIETAFWKGWDDPNVIPDIHWNHDTLQGRSLFNFSIFPHYSESVHASLVSSKSAEIDHPVVTLSDNMAAILNCKLNILQIK